MLLKGIKEMLHQWVLPKAGLLLHLPAATTPAELACLPRVMKKWWNARRSCKELRTKLCESGMDSHCMNKLSSFSLLIG